MSEDRSHIITETPNRIRQGAAFTIIDLIVAVAIIGVLFALAFVGYSRMRLVSGETLCASNLRQLALAARSYIADHNGHLPDSAYWPYLSSGNDGARDWTLWPYLGGLADREAVSILTCPVMQRLYPAKSPATLTSAGKRSYNINGFATGSIKGKSGADVQEIAPYDTSRRHINNIPHPSKMAFFLEAPVIPPAGINATFFSTATLLRPTDGNQPGLLGTDYFHSGKIHVAFVDGHVEPITREQGLSIRAEGSQSPFCGGE